MPIGHIVDCVVVFIVGVRFIDRVVREMDVKVVKVLGIRQLVFFGGKANEPLVVEIDPQRVAGSDQDVYPQIKLQSLVEQGIRYVFLDHTSFLPFKVRGVLRNVDAPALAAGLRFDDKSFDESPFPRLYIVVSDFSVVVRVEECSGEEVEFFGKLLFHFGKCDCQRIFPGDDGHIGEVIDSLLVVHFLEYFVGDACIIPFDIPIFGFCEVFDLPAESLLSADFQEDGIFGA